jgi:hypothetical protein
MDGVANVRAGLRRGGPLAGALLAGALLAAAPAAATREHRPAPPDAVRWLEPAAGRTLSAGGTVRFAWEPGPAFGALGAVEEWEIFVSYDGGVTWPIRLTPHLDVRTRHRTVRLPAPASAEARVLLRVGDERVEHEVELPGRHRIEPRRPGAADLFEVAVATRRGGERARRDGAPVVRWSEGPRDGRSARWHVSTAAGSGWTPARLAAPPASRAALAPRPLLAALPASGASLPTPPAASNPDRTADPPVASISPLARTCRRNE